MASNKKPADPASGKGKGWVIPLALLTLLAIGTGGAFGTFLVSAMEKNIDARKKEEQGKGLPTLANSGELTLRGLAPVVTNLTGSGDLWIRLESSIVFKTGALPNADVTAAEIRQDMLAYLRTVSASQIEGASGLQHLREDLNERAVMRSGGAVRELIVETLVIQ